MNKKHLTLASVAICILVIGFGWSAEAQEQTRANAQASSTTAVELQTSTEDCDDTNERCEPTVRDEDCDDADERCEPVAQDNNVCDGVTCPDGSCAATAQMCSTTEAEVDSPVRDTEPEPLDADSDDDGLLDGTELEQNHNSSRSNRTSGVAAPDFNDPDDDGDSLPTARGGGDKASPKLFDTLRNSLSEGENGSVDSDGRGDATTSASAFIKFGDIKGEVRADANTGERRLSSVAVAASDLRNWTTQDREAFTRLQNEVASTTPEAASLHITELVLADDQIEELEVSENQAQLRYRANLRLFGLIPIEREVAARTQADGSVEIDYPWYRLLSSTPDTPAIESALRTSVEILMTLTADPL